LKKTTMKMNYTNHNGCLPKDERVIIISVNETTQEVKIADPFDREWNIPTEYVNLN
jgi:hypothetical protein